MKYRYRVAFVNNNNNNNNNNIREYSIKMASCHESIYNWYETVQLAIAHEITHETRRFDRNFQRLLKEKTLPRKKILLSKINKTCEHCHKLLELYKNLGE